MRRLVLLALLAALAAGCGEATDSSEDFEGEQRRVAQVIEDLQEESTDDDPREICRRLLAPELARAAEGGCERAIDQALQDADVYDLEVKSVRISGTTATARVEAGREGDQVENIQLVRVGRDWKISRLAGAAR